MANVLEKFILFELLKLKKVAEILNLFGEESDKKFWQSRPRFNMHFLVCANLLNACKFII